MRNNVWMALRLKGTRRIKGWNLWVESATRAGHASGLSVNNPLPSAHFPLVPTLCPHMRRTSKSCYTTTRG